MGDGVGVRVRETDLRVAVGVGVPDAVGWAVGVSVGGTTVGSGEKVTIEEGSGVGVGGSVAVTMQQTVGASVGGGVGLGLDSQKYSHHPTDNTSVANSPVVTPKLKYMAWDCLTIPPFDELWIGFQGQIIVHLVEERRDKTCPRATG